VATTRLQSLLPSASSLCWASTILNGNFSTFWQGIDLHFSNIEEQLQLNAIDLDQFGSVLFRISNGSAKLIQMEQSEGKIRLHLLDYHFESLPKSFHKTGCFHVFSI